MCTIGVQLADALEYARHQHVLHRDIKPANVLIGADCVAKLADFNISFCGQLDGANARQQFGGSLAYMSPEQLNAFNPDHPLKPDELDHRSDLFSLGVVLFELLTGKLPFERSLSGMSWTQQLTAMAERRSMGLQLDSVRFGTLGTSSVLQQAIAKCLSAEPDDRFASAKQLGTTLRIGLQPDAQRLLFAPRQHWSHRLTGWFLPVCLSITLVFNFLAALFVISFHLQESIPPEAAATYDSVQRGMNWLLFPLAFGLFAFFYPAHMEATLSDPPQDEIQTLAHREPTIKRSSGAG